MSILERESNLFETWKNKHQEFCEDGIVNELGYNSSKRKILFILKETNNKLRQGFSLKNFIREGARRKQTWNNIAMWTKGIENIEEDYSWSNIQNIEEEKKMILSRIVVMNLKKNPGGHTANNKQVWTSALEDLSYLKQQFELYQADIIIGCSNIVNKFICEEILQRKVDRMTKNGVKYIKLDNNRYYICYHHPEARVADNILYFGLINAVKELLCGT